MPLNFTIPTDIVKVQGHTIYVKRDDLISQDFSGNKARKLYFYLKNNFPGVDTLISYGGVQSNMMYSLSCLAKMHGWKFIYYTRYMPEQAKSLAEGNYFAAMQNGMQVYELKKEFDNFISTYTQQNTPHNELIIHQGGHQVEAKYGIDILAKELLMWARENSIDRFNVFLPSGTGTTALYLQQSLLGNTVYTTNCVGSVEYLEKQFFDLEKDKNFYPKIFENKKFRFAQPHAELLQIWEMVKLETGIDFDLVYDPVGWYTLLENFAKLLDHPTIYIHCGGILGNSTQLLRYASL